jgi:hypothetical protein
VNAFDVVDVVEEAAEVPLGVGEVLVVRQVHLLFFDGADDAFGVAVLVGSPTAAMLRCTLSVCRRST